MKLEAKTRLEARSRSEFLDYLESITEPLIEHFWKLSAYLDQNPREFGEWTDSCHKYEQKLIRLNAKGSKFHVPQEELRNLLVSDATNLLYLQKLARALSKKGYPLIDPNPKLGTMRQLASSYVTSLFVDVDWQEEVKTILENSNV
jgi:hypothetical protein